MVIFFLRNMFLGSMLFLALPPCVGQDISLWLFDEPVGLYPSHVLDDATEHDHPLVIGLGGKIVPGRFGNALEICDPLPIDVPDLGEIRFGMAPSQPPTPGRTKAAMNWHNAHFSALMCSGEKHLRKEVGFKNATDSPLNLGAFDWTVEFWFSPTETKGSPGTVFEIGQGPLRENSNVTSLTLSANKKYFTLRNDASGKKIKLKTYARALKSYAGAWHHLAFSYDAERGVLRHFVDGKLRSTAKGVACQALAVSEEAYFSVGRDGQWHNPLLGKIDELAFSASNKYRDHFAPPGTRSQALQAGPMAAKVQGPPLLFADQRTKVYALGGRKHVFIDDAFVESMGDARIVVNPPSKMERVIGDIKGSFRKHLTVVEDEQGLIRIYNSVEDDYLAVYTSSDGVHFDYPDITTPHKGKSNIVIKEMVGGLGNPFIDPNGPPEERWKYFSDYQRRGIYLYTSPDGYAWTRHRTAVLPFRSGTQSCSFYDDQTQKYVTFHRSGIFHTPAKATQRSSVVAVLDDLKTPHPFTPLTQEDYIRLGEVQPIRDPKPWYLDNGPLTPGGFGMEYPHCFDPVPEDPVGTDIYVTKATKYPWAPDTYVAFPIVYFHYEADGPPTRQALMDEKRGRGSGPIESQLAVSRDGIQWKRYHRPVYVGPGMHAGRNVITAYIAHGMVRRGDEIWQYYFGETQYHSAIKRDEAGRGVYRLVQRLDGFTSIDSPYEREVTVRTKPFTFTGEKLLLNIDTDAAGYAQVGFLDGQGRPINGFSVDDCVYINGDFVETQVEWLGAGTDVSALQGQEVQLEFRMRGSKLYAMQFGSN